MSEPALELTSAEAEFFGEEFTPEELEELTGYKPRRIPWVLVGAGGGALVIGIGLGIGAGLAAQWMLAPGPPPPEEEPEYVHMTWPLEPVSVNLRGQGGERVLQVKVEVKMSTATPDDLDAWSPWLRDSIIMAGSDYTASELLSRPGRDRFRAEVLHRARHVLDGHAVHQVYLTEMVVK